MAAGYQILRIHAGQTFRRKWRVGKAGVYWSLAGYAVRSQIRDASGDVVVDLGTSPRVGITVTGAASEWIEYALPAALNTLVADADYVWDLWLSTPGDALKEPILTGTVKVLRRVTQ